MKVLSLRLPDELAARVEAVRGDVPWQRWIVRAMELQLGVGADQRRRAELFGPRSDDGVLPPARGSTYEEALPEGHPARVPAEELDVAAEADRLIGVAHDLRTREAERQVRTSSYAKRDVRPVPKGGKS